MSLLTDFLSLWPKNKIGSIEIQASLEEVLTDALQVTEHPVEQGAAITDHAYKRPAEVVLRCGWSNSSLEALSGAATAFFTGGSLPKTDYVTSIYSQLLALQDSRVPFDIKSSRRVYQNMLITGLQVTTDNRTNDVLMVQATCRQILIVKTAATTLPPRDSQADPAKTGETENEGTKQATTGSPAPGGSMPPFDPGTGKGW
jgi:hypothetical protein